LFELQGITIIQSLVVSDCIIVIPCSSNNYLNNLIRLLNIRLSVLFGASSSFMIDGSGANYIPVGKIKNTSFINFENYLTKKEINEYHFLLLENDIKNLLIFENKLKYKIAKTIY